MHGTGYAGDRGTSPLPQGLGWPLDFEQDSCSYNVRSSGVIFLILILEAAHF